MNLDDTAEKGRGVGGGMFAARFAKGREGGSEHQRHQNYQVCPRVAAGLANVQM